MATTLLRATPVTPARPPTLVRLSPLWAPRDPIPQRAGRHWSDPTGEAAVATTNTRRRGPRR